MNGYVFDAEAYASTIDHDLHKLRQLIREQRRGWRDVSPLPEDPPPQRVAGVR